MTLKYASTVLIIKDNKVLCVSRKNDHKDFGLVGGKCENNESFEATAERELLEETGLKANDLQFVFERQDKDFLVRTFIPDIIDFDILFSDEECIRRGEGIARWLSFDDFLSGSFEEYNRNLLKRLNLI